MFAPAPALAADPTTPECLEASESSITLRKAHKLKQARAQVLVCASPSCPAEVREECERRLPEITAAVPSVVFVAKTATGGDIADVNVTMDGQPFTTRLDGSSIEVDPGEHTFSFEAAGMPKVEQKLIVREGEKGRRETVVLGTTPAPLAPPAPAAPAVDSSSNEPSSSSLTSGMGPLHIAGLAAAGLGLVAVGVGAVVGFHAKALQDSARCPDNVCPDARSADKLKEAIDTAGVATGLFIAGGVLVAGGAAAFFLAPRESSSKKAAGPRTPLAAGLGFGLVRGGGGLSYSGSW